MNSRRIAAVLVAAALSDAAAAGVPAPDHHPPYLPLSVSRASELLPGRVEQLGEVVIMEGDEDILAYDDAGSVGIFLNLSRQDPISIARRFYTRYPDRFDALIVGTSFSDAGTPGAMAYHYPVQLAARGVGTPPGFDPGVDDSAAWGSSEHRLHSFINMKGLDDYPRQDGRALDDPASVYYPVLGQEFGHRWLTFAHYVDAGGRTSDWLLGRDLAHWSPLVQADASVMDGNRWEDDGDGHFRCVERARRFSRLDLYLMGLLPAREVTPFYVINDAVTGSGRRVDGVQDWWLCEPVTGQREDISIAQVIAAEGERQPPAGQAPRDFRVALILVTRPGEAPSEVLPLAARLERARRVMEQKFDEYTGGTGSLCTQVSAPCGGATARVLAGSLVEAAGAPRSDSDGDGVIEPGERVVVRYTLENDGPVAAQGVDVTARGDGLVFDGAAHLDLLAPGAAAEVTLTARYTGDGSQCNRPLVARATAAIGEDRFQGFAEALIGARVVYHEGFDDGAGGWGVNLAGQDTAASDSWAWGHPREYSFHGWFTFQPDAGVSGSAWFTGLERGNIQNGEVHGLGQGRATLWSPPVDLRGVSRPRLRYAAWFQAMDLSVRDRRQIVDEDRLILEGSNDGVRWFKLDQLDGADDRWRKREVDPADPENGQRGLDVTQPVWFRFSVNAEYQADLVEAGVDEFSVVGDADGCTAAAPVTPPVTPPPESGGCTVAASPGRRRAPDAMLALASLLAAMASGALRRRRAPGRGRGSR